MEDRPTDGLTQRLMHAFLTPNTCHTSTDERFGEYLNNMLVRGVSELIVGEAGAIGGGATVELFSKALFPLCIQMARL